MEQYLIPSGLVVERAREERPAGQEEARRFRLTREGQQWLREHGNEVATPATRAETQEMAREAHEAAESARASVQSYRKKLHRLRGRVEDLEGLPDRVGDVELSVNRLGGSVAGLRDSKATTSTVADLGDRVDELEGRQEDFRDEVEVGFEREQAAVQDLREENEDLRERIEELEREMEKGWMDRIFKRSR